MTGKKDNNVKNGADLKKPSTIMFVRSRMLYASPSFNSDGSVKFGLRHVRKSCDK